MTCGERWLAHWSDAESDEVIGTEAAGGATPPKFLLIEADEGLTRMLRVSLAASGLDVTQATCGDEALRALEQGPTGRTAWAGPCYIGCANWGRKAYPSGWLYRRWTTKRQHGGTARSGTTS